MRRRPNHHATLDAGIAFCHRSDACSPQGLACKAWGQISTFDNSKAWKSAFEKVNVKC
jgi:hypothetical protein